MFLLMCLMISVCDGGGRGGGILKKISYNLFGAFFWQMKISEKRPFRLIQLDNKFWDVMRWSPSFKGLSRIRDGVLITDVDLNLCRQMKDKWGFQVCFFGQSSSISLLQVSLFLGGH